MTKLDKAQIGLIGEYYVLAQFTARGFIATLTLGNTKGIDIIVTNQEADRLFKVEVKTTTSKPSVTRLFSNKKCYQWTLSKKAEGINDEKLIYCFVLLEHAEQLPKFFLVPSKDVARYTKEQHQFWLDADPTHKDTSMRKFRIDIDDPNGYENNWELFTK